MRKKSRRPRRSRSRVRNRRRRPASTSAEASSSRAAKRKQRRRKRRRSVSRRRRESHKSHSATPPDSPRETRPEPLPEFPKAHRIRTQVQRTTAKEEGEKRSRSCPPIVRPTSSDSQPHHLQAGAASTTSVTTTPKPSSALGLPRGVLPFKDNHLNAQAFELGGEIASQIIYKAASTAKLVLDTLTAKAPPSRPPPHIAATP